MSYDTLRYVKYSNQRSLGVSDSLMQFPGALFELLSSLSIHGIVSLELLHPLIVFFQDGLVELIASDDSLLLTLGFLLHPLFGLGPDALSFNWIIHGDEESIALLFDDAIVEELAAELSVVLLLLDDLFGSL